MCQLVAERICPLYIVLLRRARRPFSLYVLDTVHCELVSTVAIHNQREFVICINHGIKDVNVVLII